MVNIGGVLFQHKIKIVMNHETPSAGVDSGGGGGGGGPIVNKINANSQKHCLSRLIKLLIKFQ